MLFLQASSQKVLLLASFCIVFCRCRNPCTRLAFISRHLQLFHAFWAKGHNSGSPAGFRVLGLYGLGLRVVEPRACFKAQWLRCESAQHANALNTQVWLCCKKNIVLLGSATKQNPPPEIWALKLSNDLKRVLIWGACVNSNLFTYYLTHQVRLSSSYTVLYSQ